ncbi:MAG TPA: nitroreductase [Rubrivivax sp.]|jgi:nitroreductase|nr:nitroreductase [Rubrivivax sp.]
MKAASAIDQAATVDQPPPPRRAIAGGFDRGVFAMAQAMITSRQNVSPKRLIAPGPSAEQLDELLALAAAAPDHGLLQPWRFIVVPIEQRHRLAEVFALALIDRDPGATLEQIEAAREKAHRAPLLLVAIACLGKREPDIPPLERMVSMGAAIQNLLLGAYALGYGAGLTSGQAMASPRMYSLCGLSAGEAPVCCVNIGTVAKRKAFARLRPMPSDLLSALPEQSSTCSV